MIVENGHFAGAEAAGDIQVHFGPAVLVGIAQQDHATRIGSDTAAAASALERDIDVAVWHWPEVAWRRQTIGEYRGAEARGQRDAAVVRRAGRRLLARHGGNAERRR